MTDDNRDTLIDRAADSIETAFDRAIASPEGRAAYDSLRQLGGTVAVNGRAINPETGEVGGETRREGNGPDPATRPGRLAGYVGHGDPDTRHYSPYGYGSFEIGKRQIYLPFGESPTLAGLGEALIAKDERLAAITTWEVGIAYRWGEDLGKDGGEPRLWRLKKASPDLVWALGQGEEPRVVDLLLDVNGRIARYAEFTNWQVQATLHEALLHVKVRDGRAAIEPLSSFVREYIMRRYGARWRPDLAHLLDAMRLAETDQLPLWKDEDGDDEADA